MSKEFVNLSWTDWNDEVGGKISKEINYAVDSANQVYEKYERAVLGVEEALSSSVIYQSQSSAIQSLEVK